MCYTVLTTSFYLLLVEGEAPVPVTAATIATSLAAETVISNLVVSVGSPALHIAAALLSPISLAVCLAAAFALLPASSGNEKARTPSEAGSKSWLLVFRLMIYTAGLVCIKCLSNIGAWGENRGFYLGASSVEPAEAAAVCLFIAAMAVVVFIVPMPRVPDSVRSIGGFALVLAGMQLLALGDAVSFGNLFDLVTVSCEGFSHLLMWMAFMECSKTVPIAPFSLTGLRSIVYVVLTVFLGIARSVGIASSTVVIAAVYGLFLLLVASLAAEIPLNTDKHEKERDADKARRLDSFANNWGLSGREREIVTLLIEGAKRSDIEECLGMSEGTVRTHITRMYRKLGVHSKGELLELVEKDTSASS